LLAALRAFRDGDLGQRLPSHFSGADGEIAQAFNDCIQHDAELSEELARVSELVGREGLIERRASANGARGAWRGCIESLNKLIDDLVFPMSEAGRVLGAVSNGDLSQRMPLEGQGHPLRGEFLRSSHTINTMVDCLAAFASEVTRVAREVGSEGKLGGQAIVEGVAGTWKDLTGSVNTMAGNLTAQVRNIAEVTTAVANGDLSKKITVEARGLARPREVLRKSVMLARHDPVHDGSINEFHAIVARGLLPLYNGAVQYRLHRLFFQSLTHRGFLVLGQHESLENTVHEGAFRRLVLEHPVFRRMR
jgi:HAMP domain-containing protein